jgi:hypothetical protein
MKLGLLSNDEAIDPYQAAVQNDATAKAGTGCRVTAFISFLVAETVLANRLGIVGGNTAVARSS